MYDMCQSELIGDFVHVSVGSHITDIVVVCDDHTWIGAGTVVIRCIEESDTYIGVPVRKMEMMNNIKDFAVEVLLLMSDTKISTKLSSLCSIERRVA